ncbi:PIKK family atypical protein kinase [Histomonas meleagridis]|uniref:PIKK family atypical protein kinase n=1 Tax=Histomonas meleagridis TaxID=135588 RepID=UPI0035598854|nr:PIKK family atypical protein kinase [Histomonas meleagridis]KAH0799617.1 PIKK family atypical protein kinase [Histomonas meleagridis]
MFVRLYQDLIEESRFYFEKGDDKSMKQMWNKLRILYNSLKEKIDMLAVIFVNKIAPQLAEKKNFELFIPGYPNEMIHSVESVMDVLETQQHPRCVYIMSESGQRFKFLLKGNEDLRFDERLMQFFQLINGILPAGLPQIENDTYVATYAIVPLAKSVGLIQWFTGADTLHQLISENRDNHQTDRNAEANMINEMIGCNLVHQTLLQRYELFEYIAKNFKAMELFESMWLRSPNAETWMRRSQKFTVSYAIMAMVGYIIGLGDRHPSNIMIQRSTGRVVHIDFDESFDSASLRKSFPEKVPFRITRMIVNAFEGSKSTGLFQDICVKVMQLLRDNNSLLMAHLAIFAEETPDDFDKKSRDPKLLERCEKKLYGKEFGDEISTAEDQVKKLIQIAEDPMNYLQHYPGWCPYW